MGRGHSWARWVCQVGSLGPGVALGCDREASMVDDYMSAGETHAPRANSHCQSMYSKSGLELGLLMCLG